MYDWSKQSSHDAGKTGEYINNSLHLARKYARIFVHGHYLFREANSFPRAKLKENCELRRNQILSVDKYLCKFSHEMKAIVYILNNSD